MQAYQKILSLSLWTLSMSIYSKLFKAEVKHDSTEQISRGRFNFEVFLKYWTLS